VVFPNRTIVPLIVSILPTLLPPVSMAVVAISAWTIILPPICLDSITTSGSSRHPKAVILHQVVNLSKTWSGPMRLLTPCLEPGGMTPPAPVSNQNCSYIARYDYKPQLCPSYLVSCLTLPAPFPSLASRSKSCVLPIPIMQFEKPTGFLVSCHYLPACHPIKQRNAAVLPSPRNPCALVWFPRILSW
jgi:hypothetical protein